MSNVKKIVGVLIILVILVIPVSMYFSFLKTPAGKGNKAVAVRIKISSGMNSNDIVEKLYKTGLVNNKLFAKIYMKTEGIGKNLKAGTYKFNFYMTPVTIFNMLKNRQVDLSYVNFTIPEGYDINQIAEKLFSLGLIKNNDEFFSEINNGSFNYDFLKNLPAGRTYKLEGYLFPDTYDFEKGMSVHYLINEMLKRFNSVYLDLNINRKSNAVSFDNIIVIASMIEREAKIDRDRAEIAAVIYNRLDKKMKLQIDATVQYAIGIHKNALNLMDLKVDSFYNTYKYEGLPIGPIASPGKKSIEAALNPAKNDNIYYVAKGDGSHYFTNNYKQFLKYKKMAKK